MTRYDPILGKGVVIGRYSRTSGDTKKVTDYDEKEIADKESQLYKDAMDLAQRSGLGETDIPLHAMHHYDIAIIPDAEKAIIKEDAIDMTEFEKEIVVPTIKEAAPEKMEPIKVVKV